MYFSSRRSRSRSPPSRSPSRPRPSTEQGSGVSNLSARAPPPPPRTAIDYIIANLLKNGEWELAIDETTGRPYYFNCWTREVTWDLAELAREARALETSMAAAVSSPRALRPALLHSHHHGENGGAMPAGENRIATTSPARRVAASTSDVNNSLDSLQSDLALIRSPSRSRGTTPPRQRPHKLANESPPTRHKFPSHPAETAHPHPAKPRAPSMGIRTPTPTRQCHADPDVRTAAISPKQWATSLRGSGSSPPPEFHRSPSNPRRAVTPSQTQSSRAFTSLAGQPDRSWKEARALRDAVVEQKRDAIRKEREAARLRRDAARAGVRSHAVSLKKSLKSSASSATGMSSDHHRDSLGASRERSPTPSL